MKAIAKGASIRGMRAEALAGWDICSAVYEQFNYLCWLTSGTEGEHSPGSLHYLGLAFDLRIKHMDAMDPVRIAEMCAKRLGDEFDVALEGNHIHVEFQPKLGLSL